MWKYRKREAYHFWIDYFKAYINQDKFKKSFLYTLSANSNFKMYDKNTCISLNTAYSGKKYERYFEVKDQETGIQLAFILLSKQNQLWCIEKRHIFEVSGQWLILRDIKFYLKLIEVAWFYIDWFKRVDIAIDILINTDYLIRKICLPSVWERKITNRPYDVKWKYTWLDIWEREPKKNTWKFIRVYNKILDTFEKWKDFLYWFKEKWIIDLSRVELELRRDKCKFFKVEYLTDTDQLYKIMKNEVFGINFQFFKFIHTEDTERVINTYFKDIFENDRAYNLTKWESKRRMLKRLNDSIELWGSFKDDSSRRKAVSIFVSYYKKLRNSGLNYFDILDILDYNSGYLFNKYEKIIFKTKNRLKEVLS